jgi:hypothetical protein
LESTWTKNSATNRCLDQIVEWHSKNRYVPANLLAHLLANTGTPYIGTSADANEVKPQAQEMLRWVLSDGLDNTDIRESAPINISKPVRWLSGAWWGKLQGPITPESYQLVNSYMFYTFGGATMKIQGSVQTVGGPAAQRPTDVLVLADIDVTILDHYSFEPTTLGFRNLFSSYSAANYLETHHYAQPFDVSVQWHQTVVVSATPNKTPIALSSLLAVAVAV